MTSSGKSSTEIILNFFPDLIASFINLIDGFGSHYLVDCMHEPLNISVSSVSFSSLIVNSSAKSVFAKKINGTVMILKSFIKTSYCDS